MCLCVCCTSQVSKAACILTTQPLMRILRSREAAASVNVKTWPTIIDTGAALGAVLRCALCSLLPTAQLWAYAMQT